MLSENTESQEGVCSEKWRECLEGSRSREEGEEAKGDDEQHIQVPGKWAS